MVEQKKSMQELGTPPCGGEVQGDEPGSAPYATEVVVVDDHQKGERRR
jgi:hypothetical protein